MWSKGQGDELFSENRTLQLRLLKASKNNQNELRRLICLTNHSKVSCAIGQLDPDHKSGVLSRSQSIRSFTVLGVLRQRYPNASEAHRTLKPDVENTDLHYLHSVYEKLSAEKSKQAA